MYILYIYINYTYRLVKTKMAPQKKKCTLVIGGVTMTQGQLNGGWLTGPPVKKPASSAKATKPRTQKNTGVPTTTHKALKHKAPAPQETTRKLPARESSLQVLKENYKSPEKPQNPPVLDSIEPLVLGYESN